MELRIQRREMLNFTRPSFFVDVLQFKEGNSEWKDVPIVDQRGNPVDE